MESKRKVATSVIILALVHVLIVFCAVYITVPHESFDLFSSPVKMIKNPKTMWIIFLAMQSFYLSLLIIAGLSKTIDYGVVAGSFMSIVGGVLLISSIVEWSKKGKPSGTKIIAGLMYLLFGIGLVLILLHHKREGDKEEKQLTQQTENHTRRIKDLENENKRLKSIVYN